MMMILCDREDLVAEFHTALGLDVDSDPRMSLLKLREKLLWEECAEVCEELNKMEMTIIHGGKPSKKDWANLLKECCDLQYVLSGTIVSLNKLKNLDFDTAFELVHESNMSKLDDEGKPVYREDGKVTKGPNYKAPMLEDLIQ